MRNTNSREGKSINNWRFKRISLLKGGGWGKNVHQQHEPLTPYEAAMDKVFAFVGEVFGCCLMYILKVGGFRLTHNRPNQGTYPADNSTPQKQVEQKYRELILMMS